MRLLNLEFLQRVGADLLTEVVEHLEKTRPAPTPPAHGRILKGRRDNIHDVVDFGRACDISPEKICQELIRYSRLSLPPELRLPEKPAIHQQKKRLLQTDRARVQGACVRPIRSVRPKGPPLRPVRPERPERPVVLGLHLLRLVPPNTLVPVLTTRRTCHGLILSKHPASVSSCPGVSRVDLPESTSLTA